VITTLPSEDPLKSINYQRLISSYTEKCRYDTELWQIVNYFYLLKQIRQKDGENCFIESMAMLLVKSNEQELENLLERLFGVNRQGVFAEVGDHSSRFMTIDECLDSYSRSFGYRYERCDSECGHVLGETGRSRAIGHTLRSCSSEKSIEMRLHSSCVE
jgi:hypothetical protein